MVNLKNYNAALKHFVLFLTFFLTLSCSHRDYFVTKIEGKEIGVTNKNADVAAIENVIKPYRDNIDKDMNEVLAYAPQTLDKSGEWQSTIGNLFADITLQESNPVFAARNDGHTIDFCMLNNGGIRSIIPKGNVTTRVAFEIMPFENDVVIVTMKGEQVLELVNYIIAEKKPHPISGLAFTISKDKTPKNIFIKGQPLDLNRTYTVATSDYLYNGGDNMVFFKKDTKMEDLDYKLRNVLIDYFKQVDTIPIRTDKRILVE